LKNSNKKAGPSGLANIILLVVFAVALVAGTYFALDKIFGSSSAATDSSEVRALPEAGAIANDIKNRQILDENLSKTDTKSDAKNVASAPKISSEISREKLEQILPEISDKKPAPIPAKINENNATNAQNDELITPENIPSEQYSTTINLAGADVNSDENLDTQSDAPNLPDDYDPNKMNLVSQDIPKKQQGAGIIDILGEQNLADISSSNDANLSESNDTNFSVATAIAKSEQNASAEQNQTASLHTKTSPEQNITAANSDTNVSVADSNASKPDANATAKPKLAIIIDDMATEADVKNLKAIPYAITPSFMPPAPNHPNSATLAKEFEFYMVHLPLQAVKYTQAGALTTKSTQDEINARVAEIREQFAGAKFVNNHTGSRFTADEAAMKMLLSALLQKDFLFIDSVTTSRTKVKSAIDGRQAYVARDVFLDNKDSRAEVRKQLRWAVALAKKNGKAIAIGHPKRSTMAVLQEKNTAKILQDVEVVYVRDIYELYQ